MSVIRNIGLLILLALFGAGGFFVREGMLIWEENKALKENPEFAQASEPVRARLSMLEEDVNDLAQQKLGLQDTIKDLNEELAKTNADNVEYYDKLTACEAALADEGKEMPEENITQKPVVDTDTKTTTQDQKAEMDEEVVEAEPTTAVETQPKNIITPVKGFITVKDADTETPAE